MARKPTTYDVAQLACVSQATVSYVLSGRTDVSIHADTRARVLRAARELRYRSNNVARSLVSGKSQTVGVTVPQVGLEYHGLIVQGIHHAAAALGYRVLITYLENDPTNDLNDINLLLEHQVEGLICIADERGISGMEKWLDNVAREDIPCVVVDERTYAGRVDCIVSEDVRGAMEATQHLIGLGHQRIGHLSGGSRMSTARDRNAGYRKAMELAGLEVEEHFVVEGSYLQEEGTHAAKQMLRDTGLTAVFAANDLLALLVREEAHQLDMRVPADLAIIGYGNTELAGPLSLTSVDQYPQSIGRAAVERFLRRITEPELACEEILIPTRLVIRRSCGASSTRSLA